MLEVAKQKGLDYLKRTVKKVNCMLSYSISRKLFNMLTFNILSVFSRCVQRVGLCKVTLQFFLD